MKSKKKLLCLVLSLVLICSMFFGLVACNNDSNDNENNGVQPTNYATFIFKDDLSAKGQTIKINTDANTIPENFTLEQLFNQDTEIKYGFHVEKEGVWVKSIKGSKIDDLVPNSLQSIAIYSTDPDQSWNSSITHVIDGITYYETNTIDAVKLKKDETYLFALDSSYYDSQSKKVFEKKLETSYSENSDIIVNDNYVYTILCEQNYEDTNVHPELVKIDNKGNVVAKKALKGLVNYRFAKPIVFKGNIICATNGYVEAFNLTNLDPVWEYALSTQSKIQYDMTIDTETNSLYVFTTNGYTKNGSLIALNSLTGKEIFVNNKVGINDFGKSTIVGSYIVAPGYKDAKHSIISIDKKTGQIIDEKEINALNETNKLANGYLESPIVYREADKSVYYEISERDPENPSQRTAAYVVRTWINSSNGKFGLSKEVKLNYNKANATPVFFYNRMYIISGNGAYKKTEGSIQVIDTNSMKEIYSAKVPAVCEATPLVVEQSETEAIIMFTCNTNEDGGRVKYLIDRMGDDHGYIKTIYSPLEENIEYSMSSVVRGEDGKIYYSTRARIIAFTNEFIK